jgi:hypothetical protein
VKDVKMDVNVSNVNVHTGSTTESATKWNFLMKCIHGSFKDDKRMPGTGIKHCRTNQIRFEHQTFYDKEIPNLIIIPIMEPKAVRDWDGKSGYSAIVLARKDEEDDASEVYKKVGATKVNEHDTNYLATIDELKIALSLLKSFLECFYIIMKDNEKLIDHYEEKKDTYIEAQKKAVCLPVLQDLNNITLYQKHYVAVRKITFDNDTDQLHPVPDPQLLLAKGGSVWMKRTKHKLLPGCIENDQDSECSCIDDDQDYKYSCIGDDKEPPIVMIEFNETSEMTDNDDDDNSV